MRDRLLAEDGMTLVELLLAALMSVVVLFATLALADGLISGSSAANQLTDGQDATRRQVDELVRTLRDAPVPTTGAATSTPIRLAKAEDLVFATGTNGVHTGFRRYCIDPTSRALRVGTLASASYADPGASCPAAAAGGWTYGTLVASGMSTTDTLFRYAPCTAGAVAGSCDPAGITAVEITISATAAGRRLSLRTAVAPRNRS